MALVVAVVLVSGASRLVAQFIQYTPPGGLAPSDVSRGAEFEKAINEARWQLGRVRLSPWLSVKDLSYHSNVYGTSENQKGDFTTTVGLGVRAYVRAGSKATLAVHVLPEYVWWAALRDRRALNGRYGGGVFAYFNRLTLEAEATSAEEQSYVSSEFAQPVGTKRERGAGLLELLVLKRLSAFASGSHERWKYDASGVQGASSVQLLLLQRTETVASGGLRYRFRDDFRIGVGFELSVVRFAHEHGNRSNDGNAPVAEVTLRRDRLLLDLSVALRSLEPQPGSDFLPYQGTTGQFQLAWQPRRRFEYGLYASRNLVYTVDQELDSPYFEDERLGARIGSPFGWRVRVDAFAEKGRNVYHMKDLSASQRRDDVSAFGAGVRIELARGFAMTFGGSRVGYNSNFPGRDRVIFRAFSSVSLGGGASPWF